MEIKFVYLLYRGYELIEPAFLDKTIADAECNQLNLELRKKREKNPLVGSEDFYIRTVELKS